MNIQTVTFNKISFVNVSDPKSLEIKYLKNNFGFSSLHLDDYLNKTQVPKIEITRNYTLVVLDFPYFYQNGQTPSQNSTSILGFINIPQVPFPQVSLPTFAPQDKKRRITSSQAAFFIGRDFLVVLHDGMLSPINDIFSLCQKTLKKRTALMEEGPNFLFYYLVDALVDNCFPVINEISSSVDKIDRELETSQSGKILEEISTTRRNIVVFHTMIKPLLPLFKQLEEGKYKGFNDALTPFWENISDHLQKIWDRLEDSQELIEGISKSNESLLSSRTNRIITILTIFSAIILPLNLIASIYGMNIEGLPFANISLAFPLISTLMILTGAVLILFFKSRRWL